MAASWIVTLDPSAVISGRTELDLNSGVIAVDHSGIDWGEAAVQQYLAEQRYGNVSIGYRIPNRVITIPLAVGLNYSSEAEEEKARRMLSEKVGLLQREGGVLKRQRKNGEPLYADIVDAKLIVPDVYGERGGLEPNVVLKLECLPDFYGEEIALESTEEAGQWIGLLKQSGSTAVIKGDYPARARAVLTEKAAKSQRSIAWGIRSAHYDAATTAALAYDAYTMTGVNGGSSGTEAGTFSGKVMELNSSSAETWFPFCELKSTVVGALTHLGSYRVLVRAKVVQGTKLRLAWATDDATASTINEAMEGKPTATSWQIFDLGEIRLEEPPSGSHFWTGQIQANTGPSSQRVVLDRIWLQPLDEAAGRIRATAVQSSFALEAAKGPTSAVEGASGTTWTNFKGWYSQAAGQPTFSQGGGEIGSGHAARTATLRTFGFALGGTAKPLGIAVAFGFSCPAAMKYKVELKRAGVLIGEAKSKSEHTGGSHTVLLGGATDLWGGTWTEAQINSELEVVILMSFVTAEAAATCEMTYPNGPTVFVYYSTTVAAAQADAVLYASKKSELRTEGTYREDSAVASVYARASEETGDLIRIPPSGLESRSVQLFLKQSEGLMPEPGGGATGEEDASATDKLGVQVFYRPCYLGRI